MAQRQKQLWKITFRSAPLVDVELIGDHYMTTRLYRWWWQAKAAEIWHRLRTPRGIIARGIIEPYTVGTNIVAMHHSPKRSHRSQGAE